MPEKAKVKEGTCHRLTWEKDKIRHEVFSPSAPGVILSDHDHYNTKKALACFKKTEKKQAPARKEVKKAVEEVAKPVPRDELKLHLEL